jgi:hypothetical protein
MPTSVINPALFADALVGIADDIRGLVHTALGTRPYAVAVVTRTWSGSLVGDGTPTSVVLPILPAPKVTVAGLHHELRAAGREEEGDVELTGVSLTYAEAELAPTVPNNRTEWAYRITEAHGQAARTRYYTLAAPPLARRGDHEGDSSDWLIKLRRVQDFGATDG